MFLGVNGLIKEQSLGKAGEEYAYAYNEYVFPCLT